MSSQLFFLVSILLTVFSLGNCSEICLKLNNITVAEYEAMPRKPQFEDIPMKFRCYGKCLLKGILGYDGKLDMDRVLQNKSTEWYSLRDELEQCRQQFNNMTINNNNESCNYAIHIVFCMMYD